MLNNINYISYRANSTNCINKVNFTGAIKPDNLAKLIDHTYLEKVGTPEEEIAENIDRICREAIEHDFVAVCVRPKHIERCVNNLKGSKVKIATVIDFPPCNNTKENAIKTFGSSSIENKVKDIKNAIAKGADELDVVINVGQIYTNNMVMEARQILFAADGKMVKFIIESGILSDHDKRHVCRMILDATSKVSEIKNEHIPVIIKTSTGMVEDVSGATIEDIKIIADEIKCLGMLGKKVGIKASGGIRDLTKALEMRKAAGKIGGTSGILQFRIGTSSGIKIMNGN